jgi:hypothetical protein
MKKTSASHPQPITETTTENTPILMVIDFSDDIDLLKQLNQIAFEREISTEKLVLKLLNDYFKQSNKGSSV